MNKMHPISSAILHAATIATALLASATTHAAVTYTWTGASNSNWQTSANWDAAGQPPFGGETTSLDVLKVKNNTKNPLVYTSAEGSTKFTKMVVGTDATGGEMTLSGGAFITTGPDTVGNNASSAALTINGGDYITAGIVVMNNNANAPAILNIISGSATMLQLQMKSSPTDPKLNSTVNLDGGILSLSSVIITGGTPGTNAVFNFNGGTLKTSASLTAFNVDVAQIRDGGAVIDTNGKNSTISEGFLHSSIPGDNATDGGFTKNGSGTLTLTGTNTYTGATTVNAGTLTCSATSEMRFALKSDLTCNKVQGTGTVNFNGLFRISPPAGPSVYGSWQLVDVATLTETFNASTFKLALVGETEFTSKGGGLYTSDNWKFNTATGFLTRTPIATVIVIR
jgi:autotransporter-associated beta strand protein